MSRGTTYAATPWEVEAERRREVIADDARAGGPPSGPAAARDVLGPARGRRLVSSLRGSIDRGSGQAGTLNQKRV
jgi:hypothetical protein